MGQNLARNLASHGVRVNAVCPGYIATEMVKSVPQEVLDKNILPQIPLGRLGEPDEVARCVVFLASDDAGLITGSLVVERIFNLPGLGKFFVISALQRDYTVVMGMVIVYAALILVLNLVADLLYAVLDPRVRLA